MAELERVETARRQAEESVRESEARKRAILEAALDCIITIDHEGKIVEFNPAAEKTFGYTRAETIGKEMAALIIPPSLRDRHRRGLAHYLATEEGPVLGRRLEMTAIRVDGTEFPVELTVTRIPLEGPPMFTGYLRDITQHKQAEEQLRKLSSVIEQTDDSVVITDREGVIEYVNPAFLKKTGLAREEAIGKTPRIVKSGKQDDRFYREQLWGTILRGDVFRGMVINKKKNGELYFEEKTITPLKNEEGVITHFVSTGKDITVRKQMEEEMEKVHLAKERLEAIRTLSMTYGHNILNALTPVKSYAEMIVKKTDPADPKYRWARSILEGTNHVVEIVGKLKEIDTYSITEMGGMKIFDVERLKGEGRKG
jgi:PAS domain S-box-containing protein